jgi:hypothetical protein
VKRLQPIHRLAAFVLASSLIAACGGGGSSGGVTPGGGGVTLGGGGATPTPSPTAVPTTSLACGTGVGASDIARTNFSELATVRHAPIRVANTGDTYEPGTLAVTYDASYASGASTEVAARESEVGRQIGTLQFAALGKITHILRVSGDNVDAIAASLREQPGVESVSLVQKRYSQDVSHVYLTNDPYFEGFGQAPTLYESASIPGQWDMHVVGLRCAMAYSQAADVPSGVTANANALGNPSVKIAIIDTGEDTTHPELASKIVYEKTIVNGVTSNTTNDPDGHGTDVSGLAAAAAANGVGFIGDGGNVSIMGYRVFPTPTSACDNPGSSDPSCSASTGDIAAAINDAVANGASVISMSLGGGNCVGGVDTDTTEGTAVQNALAHNVIVVAAAGNSGGNAVDAPACATGVIAVGASALDDGQPNGNGTAIGSASNPDEYVASYSQYGVPGAIAKSSLAWGIVAPGGDPAGDSDSDDLHWIENIWTSTPYDAKDDGTCTPDYQATNAIDDCRTLIAGTSMATPHVAGAIALILSVNSAYKSPTAMKALLCSTADDINDSKEGCGRLNVYRAMATAMGDPHLP